jgi:hypothetical protein
MNIGRARSLALANALIMGATLPAHAVEPAALVTKLQGEMAFSKAVIFSCLTRQERGVGIGDLPLEYRDDLVRAQGDDRRWPTSEQPNGTVWISRTLGSHLRVAEMTPNRCEVIADQLPVSETLERTQQVAESLRPPFSPVGVKPGYNPIVFELERRISGSHTTIHMEGAEPGGLGHFSRFSILVARITN